MKLRTGVTRVVFLVGKYAIKFPSPRYSQYHFLKGCCANLRERYITKVFKGMDLADLIAPSLFCSWFGLIQVQARVSEAKIELAKEELQDLFKDVCSDIKNENFGYINGKLVCVDYAQ